jgi:hypothetical protein
VHPEIVPFTATASGTARPTTLTIFTSIFCAAFVDTALSLASPYSPSDPAQFLSASRPALRQAIRQITLNDFVASINAALSSSVFNDTLRCASACGTLLCFSPYRPRE